MLSLLEATVPYIDRFRGIRLSTRPDAIDPEVLDILKEYHVTSIELGAQSMCDSVLTANDRGHTADDVRTASRLIKEHGFELGLQMMTGLYQSSDELDMLTAREFIKLSPLTVRIYPTVVMRRTRLAKLYEEGAYRPPSLEDAVALCARLLTMFGGAGVTVIRTGLHHTPSLTEEMLAGPYHPAFKELCESRIMLDKVNKLLHGLEKGEVSVRVAPRSFSKLVGHRKSNIAALRKLGYELKITGDDALSDMEVVLA